MGQDLGNFSRAPLAAVPSRVQRCTTLVPWTPHFSHPRIFGRAPALAPRYHNPPPWAVPHFAPGTSVGRSRGKAPPFRDKAGPLSGRLRYRCWTASCTGLVGAMQSAVSRPLRRVLRKVDRLLFWPQPTLTTSGTEYDQSSGVTIAMACTTTCWCHIPRLPMRLSGVCSCIRRNLCRTRAFCKLQAILPTKRKSCGAELQDGPPCGPAGELHGNTFELRRSYVLVLKPQVLVDAERLVRECGRRPISILPTRTPPFPSTSS